VPSSFFGGVSRALGRNPDLPGQGQEFKSKEVRMNLERSIRLIAGSFVLISLALGHWVHPYWYLFTVFVGANLFQSALTRWCLMEDLLRKAGVADAETARRKR
jgi:hypothetical protein